MFTLIVGGRGSGKSAYAENYIDAVSRGILSAKKYYLATMEICDEESRERAARHRRQREGKDFITIEQPVDIEKAAEKMEGKRSTALLECISNLVANEMFAEKIPKTEDAAAEKVVGDIEKLRKKVAHLVVVSNSTFEGGDLYDDATMAYIRAVGLVNEKLAALADEVVGVAAGIPVVIKRETGNITAL